MLPKTFRNSTLSPYRKPEFHLSLTGLQLQKVGMRTPNRVLTTHEVATHNSSKFGARPCSGKHQQCRSESQWCVPEVANSGSKRGPVRDQGSLNGSALLPRPFQGTSRSAIWSRPHSASHPLDATPGPGDRADSMVPLREPRPAWPAGPAAQASRSPGLAQPRAPGNKGSGGPGVEPRVGAPAWASPSPPYPGPHATPCLPTPAPPPLHPAHPAAAGSASSPRRRDCRARPSSYRRSSFLLFLLPEGRARGRGPGGSGAAAKEPWPPAPSAQPGRRGVAWGGGPGGRGPRSWVRAAPPLSPEGS
jgi:hypothetical protein